MCSTTRHAALRKSFVEKNISAARDNLFEQAKQAKPLSTLEEITLLFNYLIQHQPKNSGGAVFDDFQRKMDIFDQNRLRTASRMTSNI